jgi:putative sterol carrier protein
VPEDKQETIKPAEAAAAPVKVDAKDRSAFLEKAQAKAESIELNESETKKRLQAILIDNGFTKFADATKDRLTVMLAAIDAWEK